MELELNQRILGALDDFAHFLIEQTERAEAIPSFLVVPKDGKDIMISYPWENFQQKQNFLLYMTAFNHLHQAKAYGFMSEVWIKTTTDKAAADNYRQGDLAKDPERKEMLMIIANSHEGKSSRNFDIERPKAGNPKLIPRVKEKEWDLAMSEGQFWKLLPPKDFELSYTKKLELKAVVDKLAPALGFRIEEIVK